MMYNRVIRPLEKALRIYAGFALTVLLLQLLGLLMYFNNVWINVQNTLSTGITFLVMLAVTLLLVRSSIWIRIYWSGAGAFAVFRQAGESSDLADRLIPTLRTLTRLLVISSILDFFFVPVFFFSDTLLLLPVSGWWLGMVDLTVLLFPQAFGMAALILAFLTHQYGLLLKERSQMKEEIELTI